MEQMQKEGQLGTNTIAKSIGIYNTDLINLFQLWITKVQKARIASPIQTEINVKRMLTLEIQTLLDMLTAIKIKLNNLNHLY